MELRQYPRVGETIYHEKLENGLHVYVDVKPDFQKSYAFFATRYGGMDLKFELGGQWHTTPAGVAHFLEHKMFDTQDGNALQALAANGASPNAFTSSALTGYYFESTEKFQENLKILLSFVSVPYFTPESVDKEQGIIGQEIRMVEDDPENEVFYAMLEGLYQFHPIRVSVAGTQASIAQITADTLYACHKAFYHPANMVLCVAGNVDPAAVCALAREILPKEAQGEIARDYGAQESPAAVTAQKTLHMEVAKPIFQLGFKLDAVPHGAEQLRAQLVGELACEALLGSSSPLYAQLYRAGLIGSDTFDYGVELQPACAFLMVGGESGDPEAVQRAILEEAARLAQDGVDDALWKRLKKAAYGNRVRGLNSFENLCIGMAQAHFAGADFLNFPAVFDALEKSDLEGWICTYVTAARAALAIVVPKGDA